jgi:hypothetical protein
MLLSESDSRRFSREAAVSILVDVAAAPPTSSWCEEEARGTVAYPFISGESATPTMV